MHCFNVLLGGKLYTQMHNIFLITVSGQGHDADISLILLLIRSFKGLSDSPHLGFVLVQYNGGFVKQLVFYKKKKKKISCSFFMKSYFNKS